MPARLHRTVNESIKTLGLRHNVPLPDYAKFPNLRKLVAQVYQRTTSESYHMMGDERLIGYANQWLNIRSWQSQVLWQLFFVDGRDMAFHFIVTGFSGKHGDQEMHQVRYLSVKMVSWLTSSVQEVEIDIRQRKVLAYRILKRPWYQSVWSKLTP